jgi:signal transduction histidine kinase
MSHELRTPLTTITGYTDLMLADVPTALPPKHRAYVERIRLAASHLLSLIEQILVYARLESRREQMQPERVALADVLRDAAALIEPVARERGIDFSIEPAAAARASAASTSVSSLLLPIRSSSPTRRSCARSC